MTLSRVCRDGVARDFQWIVPVLDKPMTGRPNLLPLSHVPKKSAQILHQGFLRRPHDRDPVMKGNKAFKVVVTEITEQGLPQGHGLHSRVTIPADQYVIK